MEKSRKVTNPPSAFGGGYLAWRFNGADKGGPFSWSNLSDDPTTFKEVIEKLTNFETMTEDQLGRKGCHSIRVDKLSREAKRRLDEICLSDLDKVYSFRIKGKERVIGIPRTSYVRILWYDPEHKVCLSCKKHT